MGYLTETQNSPLTGLPPTYPYFLARNDLTEYHSSNRKSGNYLSIGFVEFRLHCNGGKQQRCYFNFFVPNEWVHVIQLYCIPLRAIIPKNLIFNFYLKKIDLADNSSTNFSWQIVNKYETLTEKFNFLKKFLFELFDCMLEIS